MKWIHWLWFVQLSSYLSQSTLMIESCKNSVSFILFFFHLFFLVKNFTISLNYHFCVALLSLENKTVRFIICIVLVLLGFFYFFLVDLFEVAIIIFFLFFIFLFFCFFVFFFLFLSPSLDLLKYWCFGHEIWSAGNRSYTKSMGKVSLCHCNILGPYSLKLAQNWPKIGLN